MNRSLRAPVHLDGPQRQARSRLLSKMPGRFGLDGVIVESRGRGQWELRVRFVPDEQGPGAGVPPGLRPGHLLLCDESGDVRFDVDRLSADDDPDSVRIGFDRPVPIDEVSFVFLDHPHVDALLSTVSLTRYPVSSVPRKPDIVEECVQRDFEGLRASMLSRLTRSRPSWSERHPADLGVTVVEAMAYVADSLSYELDVVATEAYLGTARLRPSVRRHARLLDYPVSDGQSARMWVAFASGRDRVLSAGTELDADGAGYLLPRDVSVLQELERCAVYGWGVSGFVVPRGSTALDVEGEQTSLLGRTVLVQSSHGTHPVRIARAAESTDPLTGARITRLGWGLTEALPWPVHVDTMAWVLGNCALLWHATPLTRTLQIMDNRLHIDSPSSLALHPSPHGGPSRVPVRVQETRTGREWEQRDELLQSRPWEPHFVAESDGSVLRLRFGDGVHGRRPRTGISVEITWHVETGPDRASSAR